MSTNEILSNAFIARIARLLGIRLVCFDIESIKFIDKLSFELRIKDTSVIFKVIIDDNKEIVKINESIR